MTLFAVIEQGMPVSYPLSRAGLSALFPNYCFGEAIGANDLLPDGVVLVRETPRPEQGPGIIEEAEPVLADGVWHQQWTERAPTSEELDAREARLYAQIDREAGVFRKRFITDVPGQQQTYAEKEGEARAWTEEADPDDFPFLAAEAAVRGVPIADVAALVIATADAWRLLGAAIEGARMGGKAAVTAAKAAGDWGAMTDAAQVNWGELKGA